MRWPELPWSDVSGNADDEFGRLHVCGVFIAVQFSEEERGNGILLACCFG
jgi:hypothetical protein